MVDTDMVDTVDIFWVVYFPGMNIAWRYLEEFI